MHTRKDAPAVGAEEARDGGTPAPLALIRERLDAALGDRELAAAARGLEARLRLLCDGAGVDVVASPDGLRHEPVNGEADVRVAAAEHTWELVLAAAPPPRHQSFTALQLANPAVEVSGDPLRIAQARPVLERMFECLRPVPVRARCPVRDLARIRGRYARLAAADGAYDVHVEEAGEGPPVLLLHTAGADSRRYQALLADAEIGARWRLIAFDCPFHGRSLPPEDWDGAEYRLSQERYLGWVTGFIEQAVGEPVVLVGCSMGAAIALVAAAERPDLLRAVVALEPPLRSPGRRNPFLAHARVSGGVHNAAYVRGLMSPTSPEDLRRRAGWIYAQGAPGVYAGDLAFYSDEFDGVAVAPRIDALPDSPHDRRIRLLRDAGGWRGAGPPHPAQPLPPHARAGPLPHVREPHLISPVLRARAGRDRPWVAIAARTHPRLGLQ